MKNQLLWHFLMIALFALGACEDNPTSDVQHDIAIIPQPVSLVTKAGFFEMDEQVQIAFMDTAFAANTAHLQRLIKDLKRSKSSRMRNAAR